MSAQKRKGRGGRKAEAGEAKGSSAESAERYGAADDAVIGRAFRWSLGVLVIVAALAAGAGWWVRSPGKAPPAQATVVEPPAASRAEVEPAPGRFKDITEAAGIGFVHTNGATGEKLLPETMGGGCAFLDYNSDGHPDILFVNSSPWPGDAPPDGERPTMALYRNDGTGHFEDVTASAGLDVTLYGMGAAVGDYDNDGDPDVLITAVGRNRFFRNDGGVFTDVTDEANLAGDPEAWSTSAGFFDYDNDGDLDLFVCNYVRWTPEIDRSLDSRLVGIGRAYGPPTHFEGTFCDLYRNEGDGRFTEVSEEAGLHVRNEATGAPVAKALAVTFPDVNGDGRPDILVANDTTRNFCFVNDGEGGFAERGRRLGVAYDSSGNATGAMGIDARRFGGDERLGIFIGNFANEMTSAYVSRGTGGFFTDESMVQGIGGPTRLALTFGLFLFDYDLDGRLDLLQANGHLEQQINQVQPSQHYRQPAQLFWNAGPDHPRTFVPVPEDRVGDLAEPIVGRGAAYADIDADGDLDVLLTQVGGPPLLLRNDQAQDHHWLRCTLRGTRSNRDAIGATIELTAGGATQRRRVMPTRSYLSQVERAVTFGLGEADRVESLRVTWPDGSVQEVAPEGVDRRIVIRQAAGVETETK